eukprot:COSAG05_NODE_259_length_12737_cov_42.436145_11_plen_82_part_00
MLLTRVSDFTKREERLIDGYLVELSKARGLSHLMCPRTLRAAMRHYGLGIVDYGRFVVGQAALKHLRLGPTPRIRSVRIAI